jgi:hypothetical protein
VRVFNLPGLHVIICCVVSSGLGVCFFGNDYAPEKIWAGRYEKSQEELPDPEDSVHNERIYGRWFLVHHGASKSFVQKCCDDIPSERLKKLGYICKEDASCLFSKLVIVLVRHHAANLVLGSPHLDVFEEFKPVFERVRAMMEVSEVDAHGVTNALPVCTPNSISALGNMMQESIAHSDEKVET